MQPLFFKITYLDPGSGSLLVQLLAAGLLGTTGILVKTFWGRIKTLFNSQKADTANPAENESQKNEK